MSPHQTEIWHSSCAPFLKRTTLKSTEIDDLQANSKDI